MNKNKNLWKEVDNKMDLKKDISERYGDIIPKKKKESVTKTIRFSEEDWNSIIDKIEEISKVNSAKESTILRNIILKALK